MANVIQIKPICDEHDTEMVRNPALCEWTCPFGSARWTDEDAVFLLEALPDPVPEIRVTGCRAG